MAYMRNPEIKRELCAYLVLTILGCGLGGVWLGARGLVLAAILCGITALLHFGSSRRRYRNIARLAEEAEQYLHGYEKFQIDQFAEGELSVLETEISKMLYRMRTQTEQLQADKVYLVNSIADISHQIRTPMTSINLIISRLSRKELPYEKRWQLVHELEALLRHMEWLVETLLKISKLDAGTIEMKRESVPVRELLERSVKELTIPMELRGQTLLIECDAGARFQGDINWMAEALENVVKNCMEHTPEGGNLWISAQENALYTEIVVRDSGPGIEKEELPHLFERFYKGKNSSEKSVGIGLALARMIVESQGGTISAENEYRTAEKATGARFVIRFYKSAV